MTAPICPRLAPVIHNESVQSDYGVWDLQAPEYPRCQGSACVLWVAEMDRVHPANDTYLPGLCPEWPLPRKMSPTGRGVCRDNMRREPWPDPAKETTS